MQRPCRRRLAAASAQHHSSHSQPRPLQSSPRHRILGAGLGRLGALGEVPGVRGGSSTGGKLVSGNGGNANGGFPGDLGLPGAGAIGSGGGAGIGSGGGAGIGSGEGASMGSGGGAGMGSGGGAGIGSGGGAGIGSGGGAGIGAGGSVGGGRGAPRTPQMPSMQSRANSHCGPRIMRIAGVQHGCPSSPQPSELHVSVSVSHSRPLAHSPPSQHCRPSNPHRPEQTPSGVHNEAPATQTSPSQQISPRGPQETQRLSMHRARASHSSKPSASVQQRWPGWPQGSPAQRQHRCANACTSCITHDANVQMLYASGQFWL